MALAIQPPSREERVRELEENDFSKLYEVREDGGIFGSDVELSNDRTDIKRVVVKRSGVASVRAGDVLIAVAGRFVPANTAAREVRRIIEQKDFVTLRFWRVGPPRIDDVDIAGKEYALHCTRRKILATRWGRIQLRLGSLELVRYFVAFQRNDDLDDENTVRRGDILVGIDHEPLPILITSSDLQSRLNRLGTAVKPLTLNVFRVTDDIVRKRILTSCDIADSGGYYQHSSPSHSSSSSYCNDSIARCGTNKCEGSGAFACMCMI